MKIKKLQSVCLILACVAAGLIGCGKKDETSKQHEALTFMAPYMDVDSFIEEVHKTYPEVEIEVVPYSGANTTVYLNTILEENDLPNICTLSLYKSFSCFTIIYRITVAAVKHPDVFPFLDIFHAVHHAFRVTDICLS